MRRAVGLLCLLAAVWIHAGRPRWDSLRPEVNPAPPAAELHVLIIEDAAARAQLSREQLEVIAGTRCVQWLQEHQAQWRIWDQQQRTTEQWEEPWFLQALQLPRTSLPWIVISHGRRGYSGPLPATVDDTLQLLERYQ